MPEGPEPCLVRADLAERVTELMELTSSVKAEYEAAAKRHDPLVKVFKSMAAKVRADGRHALSELQAHEKGHGCAR